MQYLRDIQSIKETAATQREVSIDTGDDFDRINISVIPGKKICPTGRKELAIRLQAINETTQSGPQDSDTQIDDASDTESLSSGSQEEMFDHMASRHDLDTSLEDMGLSPRKLHGIASPSKVTLGKRKLQQFQDKMKDQETILQKRVAKIIDVEPEDLITSKNSQPENYKELKEKADDLEAY